MYNFSLTLSWVFLLHLYFTLSFLFFSPEYLLFSFSYLDSNFLFCLCVGCFDSFYFFWFSFLSMVVYTSQTLSCFSDSHFLSWKTGRKLSWKIESSSSFSYSSSLSISLSLHTLLGKEGSSMYVTRPSQYFSYLLEASIYGIMQAASLSLSFTHTSFLYLIPSRFLVFCGEEENRGKTEG